MTCCALGEQDAILGHVASRGDRIPRASVKLPGVRAVNPLVRGSAASQEIQSGLAALVAISGSGIRKPIGKEIAAMKAHVIAFASVLMGTMPAALAAEFMHDPPWNPEHIDHLPIEVRSAVLAKCPTRPDAGHYFATYSHDEVHLHFEHFHCAGASFCNASGCLHETYRMSSGHYRLAGSRYKSGND